ncbi:MAG: hypothetical protein RR212_02235 [Bacteroidales bacterium]
MSEEELFIQQNFPVKSPGKWKPGEPFIYISPSLNITLKPEKPILNDTTNYQNLLFEFSQFKQQTDWNGNSTLDLIFEADGRKFRFETAKTLEQISDTGYNPLIAGLIWLPEIEKADSLLKGKTFYILTSEWKSDQEELLKEARKFVAVEIVAVKPGDEYTPVTVIFKNQQGHLFSIGTTLSGTLNAASRFKFHRIFSVSDPRLKYKDISDENWQLITEGNLANGMTQAEVRLSIGKPTEINRIPTYSGLREQWLYNSGTMISFQDGRITNFRK